MNTSPFAPIQPNNMKMDLSTVNGKSPFTLEAPEKTKEGESFQHIFASFFENANDSQWKAGDYTKELTTGKLENTHEMAIAGAKSEIMLHLTTQIASKLSSATTTLFQMQI
jgi:flagellar hook-basal body complex protein FliE